MNFVGLLVHGLSAISVFSDVVSARLLVAAAVLLVTSGVAIASVIFVRFGTGLAIPGWATYTVGVLSIMFLQALMLSVVLVFNVIGARTQLGFLPERDAELFVLGRTTVWKPAGAASGGPAGRLDPLRP